MNRRFDGEVLDLADRRTARFRQGINRSLAPFERQRGTATGDRLAEATHAQRRSADVKRLALEFWLLNLWTQVAVFS